MINEDATVMGNRAALCPRLTFTETYRDHYEAFVKLVLCSPWGRVFAVCLAKMARSRAR
jgi:hypothetical protein